MLTRLIGSVVALIVCALQVGVIDARTATGPLQLTVNGTEPNRTTAVQLTLPSSVAAVDGRAYFDSAALALVGVAPAGAGDAFAPVDISGGAAFGAYGLKPGRDGTVLNLVVVPYVAGTIQLTVVVDATADSQGRRLDLPATAAVAQVDAGASVPPIAAPAAGAAPALLRASSPIKTLVGQPVVVPQDLDEAQAAWESTRLNGDVCGTRDAADDANGDGCVDVVDVQAIAAGIGQPAAPNPAVRMVAPRSQVSGAQALGLAQPSTVRTSASTAKVYSNTFTVTYAGDTPDANPGDGQCADSLGRCSLRAAMTEANWSNGPDFIGFDLPGTAPVEISISDVLPFLNDQTGGTTIDAYTQPGSRVNTAQFGSNAIPGVAIKGTGNNPKTNIFHITSSGNVIRGFALYRAYRLIGLNESTATNNTIVGNWFGVTGSGAVASYEATEDIYLDQGPSNNVIGTPALADRNIIGNATKGIDHYGPGTDDNVIQDNDFCMTPSGAAAMCSTGVDHDFGPKGTQIGGFGTNERNVFGPTKLNGIEISHGWDPSGNDTSTTWRNMDIHVEGNWIGFHMDGSYTTSFRSGQQMTSNDGNAVNIYDGCSDNVVDGNYLASAYDGVNTMVSNCFDNVIQNNIIGVSPKGQAAPLGWWGVHVREGTYGTVIAHNTIRNAARGGIGLTTGNERLIEITGNIVSDTKGPAIHLEPATGSSAPGSDNLYAPPLITSATTSSVAGTGIAGSTVEVYEASRKAGKSGLPVAFLGSATVGQNGKWSIGSGAAAGQRVTALEIAPNGNTSELAMNVSAIKAALRAGN